MTETINFTQEWDKTFKLSEEVKHKKVTFTNHFGDGIVLTQNDLLGVVSAFDMGQKTFRRILLNLFWASIYNIIGLPIVAGVFAGLGLPLNPELAGLAMALSSLSVLTSSLLLNVAKID